MIRSLYGRTPPFSIYWILAFWLILANWASAMSVRVDLTVRFERDFVGKLVSAPSSYDDDPLIQEICYHHQDCYPKDFRPNFPGSIFAHLFIGNQYDATFSFDPLHMGNSHCNIAGINFICFYSSSTFWPNRIGFFIEAPTSSITLDLNAASLSYFGEAGSYRPYAEPGCEPFVGDFCDYSGYGADFTVVEVNGKPISAIPVPAALPLLASGILCLANLRRRKASRDREAGL